ncbi:carboxypeptidase-like regulatory domain-containing protein [Chitinophaga niabensis]|uniref:carboxypeptidase-like regulatory domain-containing protein n=1 Tax=Chitinophaga niabensis TaxID=536979 RepID=UPI0031BA9E4D
MKIAVYISLILLCSSLSVKAQQEISVRIQINRLPNGSSPTKVYQFQATPGLVTVTLINRTNTDQSIYLTGTVTGDNGVKVSTAKGYRPGTIALRPLETKTLNAIEAGNLFDVNYLVYTSGSNNIKPSILGEQGLPEGSYQVCVRAFHAGTFQPMSEEEPIGCSNVFFITTLEPPVILNPFNESSIPADPVQNIALRWTTPPGAPPSVSYRIRIVELFNNRNPNDAILSTPTPFFETTVQGTPALLYSMQYPQLQEGRSYAMMITATDPMGGASFRNQGRSEVIRFTYGKIAEEVTQQGNTQAPAEYATNVLKGRLLWTFKKTEQGNHSLYTGKVVSAVQKTTTTAYVATNAFQKQVATTPLIKMNTLLAVNTDNTLKKVTTIAYLPSLPTDVLADARASSTSCTYEDITVDSSAERYPLEGVNVTLNIADPAAKNGTTLLATGKTDGSGIFTLQFLHPSYTNISNNATLTLSVQTSDFESSTFRIPASAIRNKNAADIGTYLLLAKTYRFYTKVTFQESDDTDAGNYGVHLYRDATELETRPWLLYEGQAGGKKQQVITVDGRKVIEIGRDSITGTKITSLRAQIEAWGTGRIFYGGNTYLKIIPASASYRTLNSTIAVLNTPVPSAKILQAKATYELYTKPSHIEGTVALFLNEQGSVPVKGATVRMLYKTVDVEKEAPGLLTTGLTGVKATAYLSAVNNKQNVSTTLSQMKYTPAILVQQTSDNKMMADLATSAFSVINTPPAIPDGFKALTVTTDEQGQYYVSNLPVLKAGKTFLVEVIKTPYEFSTFVVRPKSGGEYPVPASIGKGISKQIDFAVDADVADVVGRIVDDKGQPLQNVRVNFKGNTLCTSGESGIFQFKLYPGNHTVTLDKEGFVEKQATINIPQLTGNNKEQQAYLAQWKSLSVVQKQQATLSRIAESPTVKAALSRGNTLSAAMFGIAADTKGGALATTTQFNSSLAVAFGMPVSGNTPGYELPRKFAVDVRDIGYLSKISGKVRFRIVDELNNSTRIPGAVISLFDTTHVTDNNGEWYYEGFGGTTTITVTPPLNSTYVPEQRTFALTENGTEEVISISLKKGVRITGRVTSGGQPLRDARIAVDDQDFLSAVTDAQGNYVLYTTAGEHILNARKQNYVGMDNTSVIPAAGTTINFELKGGDGRKNYGKLLGFNIELSAVETLPNGKERWSGAFTDLKPVNVSVFSIAEKLRIPFSNLVVSFEAGTGNAIPDGQSVKTDMTALSLRLFGYLPVKLQGEEVITFTRTAGGTGQLSGNIRIDFNAIQGYRGWSISDNVPVMLAAADKIIVFSSAAQAPALPDKYIIATKAAGKLYGFNIALNNGAVIDNNGIEFKGTIATPALGPVKSMNIGLNRLFLNRALAVGGTEIQTEQLPSLEIAGWKAAINNLLFNEDGFKLGGTLSLTIPRSGTSNINFTNLSIAKDGMFGGSFSIPESGINILSVANINTDGSPLSFSRLGNSNVYRVGGKANFKVNVDIVNKSFKVPSFEIMTNGDFSLQVPANYSTTIGPFGFSIGNIYINTTDNTPFIGIQGTFKADLDFLKFEVADLKIKPTASGPSWSIEKLGVKLDVPVVQTDALVAFSHEGFSGNGSLRIPGTPVNGSIKFEYFKRANGTQLKADFFTNLPPVPIGGPVTLDGIGGGFAYKEGGANGGFQVDVRGKLSFAGTGPLVAVNPLGLTVSSAGILKGYGDVEVASYLKTAHAEVIFDGPDKTFTIQINTEMSPLQGLMSQKIEGALVISAKPDDEFAFLGCRIGVKLLGLINNHGELAMAIRLKNPKTRGGIISPYFEYAPEDFMRERFSGVYVNAGAQLGIPKDRPFEFDLFVASAKLWCSSEYRANLLLNLEEMAFQIKFGGKFDAGIEGCVAKIACVGLSAGLCYMVEGSRNDTQGWYFGAVASGEASFSARLGVGNCKPGCNEIVTITDGCVGGSFKVCGAASLDFGFSEREGVRFKARAGGTGAPCF